MDPERWQVVKERFAVGAELPAVEREPWLEELAANDPEVAREVRSLLGAHEAPGEPLEELRVAGDQTRATGSWVGRRIGPYEIVRLVGEGGMGAVFLAERIDEEFRHRVAVKVLRAPFPSEELVARFRIERQALAQLNHPNIARLLDGGTTAEGWPYLVMEYVEGRPIDEYCDREGLSLARRIRLFLHVCGAVEHAHRSFVVHRDLKPSNILVTEQGHVRLLDFGIAKIVGDTEGAAGVTRTTDRVLTPEFASPEQIQGGPITVATDVYGLGLLFYRLLTGEHPHTFASSTPLEIERAVCDRPPTRPSSRAAERGTQASIPARALVGDLDNVALMALRKEPERRYATAAALADDLRRYLDQLPVAARGDSFRYRASRFVQRNRVAVVASAAVILSLVVGLAVAARQAHRAAVSGAQAQHRFDELRSLARSMLYELHDGIERLPGSTPVREQLVARASEYLDGLEREAGDDPGLLFDLASAYQRVADLRGNPALANLGDVDGALASYGKASRAVERLLALRPDDRGARFERARIERGTGDVLFWTGATDRALAPYNRALAEYRALAASDPSDAAAREEAGRTLVALASYSFWNGDHPQSLAQAREARELLAPIVGSSDEDLAFRAALDLGSAWTLTGEELSWNDRAVESEQAFGEAIPRLEALFRTRPDDGEVAHALFNARLKAGDNLGDRGRTEDRLAHYRAALEVATRAASTDPQNERTRRDASLAHATLGDAFLEAKRFDEAHVEYQANLELLEALGRSSTGNRELARDLANAERRLALLDIERGNPEEARARLERLVAVREQLADADRANGMSQRDLPSDVGTLAQAIDAVAARQSDEAAVATRSAACQEWRRANDLWNALETRGMLQPFDQSERTRAQTALRDCDR